MSTDPISGGFFAGLVRRPVTLFVLFVTLIVVGVIANERIPLQMMPDGMKSQSMRIWVMHPGSSGQENAENVARPLEEQLRTIAGVTDIESWSGQDSCSIRVRFGSDQDADVIKAEVRDRIERTRPQLPDTVDRIRIFSWNQSELPLMWLAILAKNESERTDYLMDAVIQRRLDAVDGVGQAQIFGMLDDSVRILLDEDKVRAAQLDIGELIGRLSSDNFALPMGEVDDGGRLVLLRSDMRFEETAEIEDYPIGNGLALRDVGRVIKAKSVRDDLSRIDGQYAYWAVVRREGQANVVATCKRLDETFDELRADPRLAGEFDFLVVFNQGNFIENSLGQLKETALWGGGLALAILFVFLRRVRLTLCVGLAIPTSVLLTIAWTYFAGGTFNVLTMTGITFALGMLVDNSVVVIENISRLRDRGLSRTDATVEGMRDVSLAVTLATLTTIVVFLPMIFMTTNPDMRVIFGELGTPLCLSLTFSLIVALFFLPVIAARVVGPRAKTMSAVARVIAPIAAIPTRLVGGALGLVRLVSFSVVRAIHAVARVTLPVLSALRWPLAAGLVALVALRVEGGLPRELGASLAEIDAAPSSHQVDGATDQILWILAGVAFLILVRYVKPWRKRVAQAPKPPERWIPAGQTIIDFIVAGNRLLLGWTLRHRFWATVIALIAYLSIEIPKSQMEVAAFGQEESTNNIALDIDFESDFTLAEASDEFQRYEDFFAAKQDEYGFENVSAQFSERGGEVGLWWMDPTTTEHMDWIRQDIRTTLPRWPAHSFRVSGDADDSRSKTLVVFRLHGPDPDELEAFGRQAMIRLAEVPGLTELSNSLEQAPEQLRLVFDQELGNQMGVTANVALQNISWALRGFSLPRFQEEGREIPLLIEYDEEEVAGLDTLRDLAIWTGLGTVPLSSVAEFEFTRGSRTIYRRNGKTSFTIVGRVASPSQQEEVSAAGYAALASMELPRGYSVGDEDLVGRRQEEELAELKYAAILSLALVYVVMGILFESFILPFAIITTVPFALVGAWWTLFLTGTQMDSVGWIGFVILVGVVVNNGIILIDRIHRLRPTHDRTTAVLEGKRDARPADPLDRADDDLRPVADVDGRAVRRRHRLSRARDLRRRRSRRQHDLHALGRAARVHAVRRPLGDARRPALVGDDLETPGAGRGGDGATDGMT